MPTALTTLFPSRCVEIYELRIVYLLHMGCAPREVHVSLPYIRQPVTRAGAIAHWHVHRLDQLHSHVLVNRKSTAAMLPGARSL